MTLEEAINIRQIEGGAPAAHLIREARRVIELARSMSLATRSKTEFPTLSKREIERTNSLLAYRLALACGKLNDWAAHGRIEERKAA